MLRAVEQEAEEVLQWLRAIRELSLETHSPDKSQLCQGLETSLRPLALTQPDQEPPGSVSESETIVKIHVMKGG